MTRPDLKVEIAFNATYSTAASARTWNDITADVEAARGITIGHARQDEFSQADSNTCSLTLDNADGRFTPGLASSPYYPNIRLGRPLRVSVNLCTHGDNGTFEADATGWTGINATVARSTAQAHAGSASLSVTATSAANISGNTPSGISGIPVAPSTTYRASAWVRTAVTARTVDMRVDWYDAAGALISTGNGTDITDSTAWQQVTLTATAPSTAAYARVRTLWLSAANGEVHYLDDVRLDSDRFTGYVDEWPLEWPDSTAWATTTISATSRMARLGLSNKLRSIIEQEILVDAPAAYYTLGEADGATRANDSSGNSQEALTATGTGAAVTFGSATGPSTDGLTAAQFTAGGKYLAAEYGANLTSGDVTIECFFLAASAPSAATNVMLLAGGDKTGGLAIVMEVDGKITGSASNLSATTASNYADGQTHHVAVTHNGIGDGSTIRVYIDGAQVASTTDGPGVPIPLTPSSMSLVLDGPAGVSVMAVTIAHAAVFDSELSASRIAAHADAGLTGFSAETAVTRLARYAGYAGIPAAEYSFSSLAVTPMAHIDTTGKTPVELMQTVATTDGGALYDGRDGVLTYEARTVRYNATAALTLDVAANEVEVGYQPKVDRSALINKVTATLSDGTYSAPAENAASITEYGEHGPGDLELHTTSQAEAHAAAWWRVNLYGEPSARAPQLGVEIASLSAARQAAVLAVKVSQKIDVSNLPSQSDAASKSFFAEGYAETITDSTHRIEFNVSPAAGFEIWEVDHATYGQYDLYPLSY